MKRTVVKICFAAMFIVLVTNQVWSQSYSGGSGTGGNPYQIGTKADLKYLSENSGEWSKNFIQTANITFSGSDFQSGGDFYNGGGGFIPIGNTTTGFAGSYNGHGFSIDGLTINRSADYQAMFGVAAAVIDSVRLTNVSITAHDYVGGLVGEKISITVNNCSVAGYVNGSSYAGTLVGYHFSGTISNSSATGFPAGSNRVGGLVGFNKGTVSACYAQGSASGVNYVGGLVGDNEQGTITNCYSLTAVSGSGAAFGGLVGENNNGTISNSYSTGTVSGGSYVGGLVGFDNATVSNSFWDTQTSGQNSSAGGTGKTTAEMKSAPAFITVGWSSAVWNMATGVNSGYPHLRWQNPSGASLLASTTPSGIGTSVNPYLIATLDNLFWVSQTDTSWNKYFKQTANINATPTSSWSGGGWTPIGNSAKYFTGSYEGQGFTIDMLTINRPSDDNQGFFGLADTAMIDSVGVTNVTITGNDRVGGLVGHSLYSTVSHSYASGTVTGTSNVGGLVGWNNGTMYNSFATGNVSGGSGIGGLVGDNSNTGTVSSCYATGSVTGTTILGGLVGYNPNGAIHDSYATGSVSGSGSGIGGLVGENDSTINSSYATGSVSGGSNVGGLVGVTYGGSTVSNSFWDTQTSGQSSSAGGTGRTTPELKDPSTFLSAGWNQGVWFIDGGFNNGYPYLSWQNEAGSPLPITLVSFKASANSRNVELMWSTGNEVNNYRFEIERRLVVNRSLGVNGSHGWTKIGFVEGNGTTNSQKEYSFTDKNLEAGKHSYRLKQIDNDGKFKYSQVVEVEVGAAQKIFTLAQNYPNPFNPSTTIGFTLQVSGLTSLKIYDAIGREVATLVNENLEAGVYHQTTFSASHFATGIYFARLMNGDKTQIKKMMFLK